MEILQVIGLKGVEFFTFDFLMGIKDVNIMTGRGWARPLQEPVPKGPHRSHLVTAHRRPGVRNRVESEYGRTEARTHYGYDARDPRTPPSTSATSDTARRATCVLQLRCPSASYLPGNWLTLNIGNRSYGLSKYRIYDPELGIFLSRDFLPYPNKYRAWSNNPVKQVDHSGLKDSDSKDQEKVDAERHEALIKNRANVFAEYKKIKSPDAVVTPKESKELSEQIEDYLKYLFFGGAVPEAHVFAATDCGKITLYGGDYDREVDKALDILIKMTEAARNGDLEGFVKAWNQVQEIDPKVLEKTGYNSATPDAIIDGYLLGLENGVSSQEMSDAFCNEIDDLNVPGVNATWQEFFQLQENQLTLLKYYLKYRWYEIKGPQILKVDLKNDSGSVVWYGNVAFPLKSALIQELLLNKYIEPIGRILPTEIVLQSVTLTYQNTTDGNFFFQVDIIARYGFWNVYYKGTKTVGGKCGNLSLKERFEYTLDAAKNASRVSWKLKRT